MPNWKKGVQGPQRKYVRKKRRKNKIVKYRRSLPLGGFPNKHTVRLKYCDFITLNATSSGSAVPLIYHFRANSLYDPDLTSSGHQPRGYDELSQIYDHFCVIGSKIKVSFENDKDHVQQAGQYCFLMLQDTNNTPTSLIDILEESNKNKVAYKQRNSVSSRNIVLTKKFSPYKMFGLSRKDSLLNNIALNCRTNTNPAEDATFTLGIACASTTTTDPPPVIARVEIEYLAVFTEKRPMSMS